MAFEIIDFLFDQSFKRISFQRTDHDIGSTTLYKKHLISQSWCGLCIATASYNLKLLKSLTPVEIDFAYNFPCCNDKYQS